MTLQDFVANFAAQFDETDVSAFNPETKFHDLDEWSSLLALSIIAMVDDEYDFKLKGNDIRHSFTIKDIFDIVNAAS